MLKVLVCFAIFQISARPTRPRPEGGGGSNQGSYGFCLFPLSKAAPKNIRLLHPPPRLNIDHIGFKKRCLKFDLLPSSKHRLDSNPCHPMRSPTKSQPSLVNLYLIDQTETTKGQKAKFIATYNCLFKILLRRHCGHFFLLLVKCFEEEPCHWNSFNICPKNVWLWPSWKTSDSSTRSFAQANWLAVSNKHEENTFISCGNT